MNANAKPSQLSRWEILGAAALFSTGGAAIKATTLSGLQVAGGRSLVAAIALLIFLPEARKAWNLRVAAVAAAYAITMVLFVAANKLTTAANTIFLQATAPVYVVALGPWLLGESVRRRDIPYLIALGVGMTFFFLGSEPAQQTAPNPALGNIFAALSGFTWAGLILGFRWLESSPSGESRGSAQAAAVMGNIMAVVMCAPWMLTLGDIEAKDALVILYLGVFQIGLAYVFLTRGVRGVSALEVSLLLLLEPVLNPIWAWLVHRENPGAWAIAGGFIIMSATLANILTQRDKAQG